jgi:hypothetical protein
MSHVKIYVRQKLKSLYPIRASVIQYIIAMKTSGDPNPRKNRLGKIKGSGHGPAPRREADGKPSAYGETKPICMNAGCVLRKKAKCFGFEGCPGFKGV